MRRIFLIDDDTDDAELFEMALGQIDYPTVFVRATNGQEALGLVKDSTFEKPDLIFLDLNMPVMNGVEFLEQMRGANIHADVPVFIYSTSSDGQDVEKCLHMGARLFTKHNSFGALTDGLQKLFSEHP